MVLYLSKVEFGKLVVKPDYIQLIILGSRGGGS